MTKAFKRWLDEYYPDEAGCHDVYIKLYREWLPRKLVAIQMAALVFGMMAVILPLSLLSLNFDDDIVVIGVLILMGLFGVGCLLLGATIYDRKRVKPQPKKPKETD